MYELTEIEEDQQDSNNEDTTPTVKSFIQGQENFIQDRDKIEDDDDITHPTICMNTTTNLVDQIPSTLDSTINHHSNHEDTSETSDESTLSFQTLTIVDSSDDNESIQTYDDGQTTSSLSNASVIFSLDYENVSSSLDDTLFCYIQEHIPIVI